MKKPLARIIPLLARGLAPSAAIASSLLSPVAMGASGDLDPLRAGRRGLLPAAVRSLARPGRRSGSPMKKPPAQLIPSLARGVALTAAIASSLFSPLALGGQGDLDPEFGDVGRTGPIASVPGTAWSIYAMEDGSLAIGGSEVSLSCPSDIIGCILPRYVGFAARSFLIRVSDAGQLDEGFQVAAISDFHLLAIARQSNAKFLAAGRRLYERSLNSEFVVYRLNQDGSLDTGFGASGLVQLPAEERGEVDEATAVLVEPNGRIVVAGSRLRSGHRQEILIRLLANGDIDQAFGTSGIVVLSGRDTSLTDAVLVPLRRTQVLRTAAGAYRASASNWCRVVGLASDGTLDPAFGSAGTAQIHHPISNSCSLTMAMQDDGRLVVGASDGEAAVVTRLLAGGQPDPSYLVGTDFQQSVGHIITALAVGSDGAIVVALGLSDFGYHGLKIKRLLPSGELDASFGNAGSTEIDMPSEFGSVSLMFDMLVRDEGTVVAAGGNPFASIPSRSPGPIIVRLLGKAGGESPGVLGVKPGIVTAGEGQQAVITVRRTGGDSERVSVAYQTATGGRVPATRGEDYTHVTGRLSWADGDRRDQEIRVPIASDAQSPEESEQFLVVLSDPDGGAGFGTRNATVEILGDGDPHGQFAIEMPTPVIAESQLVAVRVHRNYYFSGAVSVTVTPTAGTATAGDDFDARPVTLSWADREGGAKSFSIAIRDDAIEEPSETFTVALSNPTGGAIIGPRSSATLTIQANDQPSPRPMLSFSANPTSVVSGASTTLSWSSTSVNSCTASGGWTGSRDTSGTESTVPLSATTTFTLSCTGAGGSIQHSTTVTVRASPSTDSSSGGGAVGLELLALLGLVNPLGRVGRPKRKPSAAGRAGSLGASATD